jgi:hypothetical protein
LKQGKYLEGTKEEKINEKKRKGKANCFLSPVIKKVEWFGFAVC